MGSAKYISVAEYAEHLGLSESTVTRHLRKDRIPGAIQHGGFSGSWRIPAQALYDLQPARNARNAATTDEGEDNQPMSYTSMAREDVRRLTKELAAAKAKLRAVDKARLRAAEARQETTSTERASGGHAA